MSGGCLEITQGDREAQEEGISGDNVKKPDPQGGTERRS